MFGPRSAWTSSCQADDDSGLGHVTAILSVHIRGQPQTVELSLKHEYAYMDMLKSWAFYFDGVFMALQVVDSSIHAVGKCMLPVPRL